ncbi:antitoxin (DNA-binding transcriptional repressor) of toxin-antitoxin stability system [Oxalobacteraceae bacterium GrIS 2.11]
MEFSRNETMPLSQARANFSELADQAKAGSGKIITKNVERYVALINVQRLELAYIGRLLIDEVNAGLNDVESGQIKDARATIKSMKRGCKLEKKLP